MITKEINPQSKLYHRFNGKPAYIYGRSRYILALLRRHFLLSPFSYQRRTTEFFLFLVAKLRPISPCQPLMAKQESTLYLSTTFFSFLSSLCMARCRLIWTAPSLLSLFLSSVAFLHFLFFSFSLLFSIIAYLPFFSF